jgi:hypothetical protein
MTRRFRLVVAVLVAVPAAAGGCGGGDKPNPDLKVPDVPAGRSPDKGEPLKDPRAGKKAAKP